MIRDDIMAVKKEVKELREKGFALELLSDFKRQNKRQFIIILVILGLWFLTIGYLVYVLNDIGTIETTTEQEITDVNTINNSSINNGVK